MTACARRSARPQSHPPLNEPITHRAHTASGVPASGVAHTPALTYRTAVQENRPAGHAVAVSFAFRALVGPKRTSARLWAPRKESKMPKMKTKSAAKKRFKITGTGKV